MGTVHASLTPYQLTGDALSVDGEQTGTQERRMTERVRWRMTFDELSYRSKTRPQELDHWRALGVFGDRWKEPRDRGCWRHITKLVAQRAILMRALVEAGLTEGAASQIVRQHEDIKDKTEPIQISARNGVQITVNKRDLNLP